MSRQSKNARNLAKARDITKLHLQGEKGPARTTPTHGKKWGYRDNPDVLKRIAEMLKAANGGEDSSGKVEKTAGKRILRGAGKASQPGQVEA
jgi:hypothetical protein